MNNKTQPSIAPARRPSSARNHAGGASARRARLISKKNCALANPTIASVHAHTGTILISAVSPVGVSFFTCIAVSVFSLSLLFSVVVQMSAGQMSAASQEHRTHHQRRDDPEERKARLPNRI